MNTNLISTAEKSKAKTDPFFMDSKALLDGCDGTDKLILTKLYSRLQDIRPILNKVSKPNSNDSRKVAVYDRIVAENLAITIQLTEKKEEFKRLVLAKLDFFSGIDETGLDPAKIKRIKFNAAFWAYDRLKFSDFFVSYLANLKNEIAKISDRKKES